MYLDTTSFYLVIIAVLLAIAFWLSCMRARSLAMALAKKICQRYSWQWLDYSLALKKITLKRNESGWISIWREYEFEHGFEHRHAARIIVFASRVWWQGGDIDGLVEHDTPASNVVPFVKRRSDEKKH